MTDVQLYLSIGVPTLAILVGILINGLQMHNVNLRIGSVETSLNARMSSLEGRMTNLENKFDTRFDLLLSKIVDIDNRLIRLE